MKTDAVTFADLAGSVLAVPPLARNADLTFNKAANAALIKHIEGGRGDARCSTGATPTSTTSGFTNTRPSLDTLAELAAPGTWVIPSVGPDYGKLMDQAAVLKTRKFPTAMVLPMTFPSTPGGAVTGLRKFAEAYGKPIIVYVKAEGYLTPEGVKQLVDDGIVAAIKYAIVRPDPTKDAFLSQLVELVDRKYIVSGIGERPVITHLRDFGLNGFTSGSVCVGAEGVDADPARLQAQGLGHRRQDRGRTTFRWRTRATPIRPSACCTRPSAWRASPTPGRCCRCCRTSRPTSTRRSRRRRRPCSRRTRGCRAVASRKRPEDLRSHRWFGVENLRAFGHRSRIAQMGYDRDDYAGKPVIAVINTWNDINPCHQHFKGRVEEVKRGVWEAGGFPLEMPALSLAENFQKPSSMLYRNLLAMEAEELLRGYPIDGCVMMGGCDKTTPALVMGATSMNLPTIYFPAGPMLRGNWRGEVLGSGSDAWKYWAELRAGNITEGDWKEIEGGIARSPGTCMVMGTASTMTAIAETLGLTLPGGVVHPGGGFQPRAAGHRRRASASWRWCGRT